MSSPFCCGSEIGTAFGIPNCPLTDAKKKDVRRSRIETIALQCFMVGFLAKSTYGYFLSSHVDVYGKAGRREERQ